MNVTYHQLPILIRHVGQELTLHLVLAYVITRLDYCNSLLAGLPLSSLEPLQRVQNAVARLVFQLSSRDHVTHYLYSCTGCRYAGGFSSSCVSLCTAELQPTSTTPYNL